MKNTPDIKKDFALKAENAEKPRVTIIGTGNGGCALAADLINRGFQVCLYAHPDHAKKLNSIQKRGTLISEGVIKGEFKPALLTKDMKEAVFFADYVLVAAPSFAQKELFNLMAPHLTETGRNLEQLGLTGMDQKAILNYVRGISPLQKNVDFDTPSQK